MNKIRRKDVKGCRRVIGDVNAYLWIYFQKVFHYTTIDLKSYKNISIAGWFSKVTTVRRLQRGRLNAIALTWINYFNKRPLSFKRAQLFLIASFLSTKQSSDAHACMNITDAWSTIRGESVTAPALTGEAVLCAETSAVYAHALLRTRIDIYRKQKTIKTTKRLATIHHVQNLKTTYFTFYILII